MESIKFFSLINDGKSETKIGISKQKKKIMCCQTVFFFQNARDFRCGQSSCFAI